MATNSESAKQWLKNNHKKVTTGRIKQIIVSLNNKINVLTPDNQEYVGLLEALDEMDRYLLSTNAPNKLYIKSKKNKLDSSALVREASVKPFTISIEEKNRRFKQLLEKSDI